MQGGHVGGLSATSADAFAAQDRPPIGSLRIANLSDLADVSDYAVVATEAANPLTGAPARIAECTVVNHPRQQSVFALLRAAAEALEGADWVDLRP